MPHSLSVKPSYSGIAINVVGLVYGVFLLPDATEFVLQRRKLRKPFHLMQSRPRRCSSPPSLPENLNQNLNQELLLDTANGTRATRV